MTYFFTKEVNNPYSCKDRRVLLSISILAGLIAGVLSATSANEPYINMIRMAMLSRQSILGFLGVFLLPLLISIFFVYNFPGTLLIPVSFIKAFLYAFCARIVTMATGSAAWVYHILFLFSDTCFFVILCWFWYRHCAGNRITVFRDTVFCITVLVLLGTIDYVHISPYLVILINN